MITFSKAQLISLLATGVDFGIFFLLLHWAGAPVVAASATGTICGGFTNFMFSRNWVFSASEKKWTGQLNRFVLVWIGNFVLNTAGVYLLSQYTPMAGWLDKTITAVTVAVFYNYTLQKRFVFR